MREYEHKCRALKTDWDKGALEPLVKHTGGLLDGEEWTKLLAPGARRSLQFDLLYCLWRHRIFLQSSLFFEVTSAFIHGQYQIPRTLADSLIETSLKAMNQTTLKASTAKGDALNHDFLKYVFISSATANDDNSLIADLGLGTGLIGRIKVIAESLIAGSTNVKPTVTFEPVLDDILREIMLSISEELKATPWIIDVYGLDYLLRLASLEKPLKEIELPVTSIFQVLLNIGREGIVSFGSLVDSCRKIPGIKERASEELLLEQVKLLASDLLAFDLIFEENRDPVLSRKTYRLTEAAQRLTSDAFACKFLRAKEPEFDQIAQLYPLYQIALIRRIPDHLKHGFMEGCRRNAVAFSPKAIDIAIRSLARGMDHNEIMEIFVPILEDPKAMTFTKAAVMRGLGSLHKADQISSFLHCQSQSPTLPEKLRQTAKIALTHIESRPRKTPSQQRDPFASVP